MRCGYMMNYCMQFFQKYSSMIFFVLGKRKSPQMFWFFLNFGYKGIIIKPSDKRSDGLTYIRSIRVKSSRVKSSVLSRKASLHFWVRLTILDLPYTIRLMSLNLLLCIRENRLQLLLYALIAGKPCAAIIEERYLPFLLGNPQLAQQLGITEGKLLLCR